MTDEELPRAVASRFALGRLSGEPELRHGGVNPLWRLRTERSVFAVHSLLSIPRGVDAVSRCDGVMRLELAAASAGVRIARPIPDPVTGSACVLFEGAPGPIVVHEWVDAEPSNGASPPVLYRRLGSSLGRIHALGFPGAATQDDVLARRTTGAQWRGLSELARDRRWPWADDLERNAEEFAAALVTTEEWDRDADDDRVHSHRDLTSQNVLDQAGHPVIIDWEDAGPIGRGTEIGRTALDNLLRDGLPDRDLLHAFLGGYREAALLPPVGRHWCSLWVLGLVIYTEQCARQCIEGSAPAHVLDQRSAVVEWAVVELRRRLALVDRLVASFDEAV